MTFLQALEKAQLTPERLMPLGDDEDSNGDVIKRWDNVEHGEYITIELSIDGYLQILGRQVDYIDELVSDYENVKGVDYE